MRIVGYISAVALILIAVHGAANAQILGCGSTAVTNGGNLAVCPAGDGETFALNNAVITLTILDITGLPFVGIPRCDFYLIDCDPTMDLLLCDGSNSSNADFNTDANGMTTISGTISASGCADGLRIVVFGEFIPDPTTNCITDLCVPIAIRSVDLDNMDGLEIVNLVDLATIADAWPPNPYSMCVDFNQDGTVGLQDLAFFGFHFENPAHICDTPACSSTVR